MDTVHRQPVEQICYSADGAVTMSPQGIGGDDRCGVWMILQILRTAKCHVLFCEDEEVGCVGAKKFTRGSLRPQVNYIVVIYVVVGILIGYVISSIIRRKHPVGFLRIDKSDPDGPYLFLELKKNVNEIIAQRTVLLEVKREDFIPHK